MLKQYFCCSRYLSIWVKLFYILLLAIAACNTPYDTTPPELPVKLNGTGILVFTKVAGFRHASTKTGAEALQELGKKQGWQVVDTDNGAAFNTKYLSHFKVVVWLNTTWDVLSEEQQHAFEQFIENGGGYVGIHAAADTEYGWNWYGKLVGARFTSHPNFPNVREGVVTMADAAHIATDHLPKTWKHKDEWYNFQPNPKNNKNIKVLASVDESTYKPGKDGMGDHPVIWCQRVGQGRSFYTALGHTEEAYKDSLFQRHLLGAIIWAGKLDDTIFQTNKSTHNK